jgi:ATP-dependent DNA ligase
MSLCSRALLERKRRLRRLVPVSGSRLLYLEHVAERGRDRFQAACDSDLEGIVAKYRRGSYCTAGRATRWLKIENPKYP